jgi:sugar diacid utilization regulator
MSESRDEELILRFASSSVTSFGPFQLVGIHLSGIGWYKEAGRKPSLPGDADIDDQLPHLTGAGGPLTIPGYHWAWGYCLRSLEGLVGHLAVSAEAQPTTWAQFLVGILAQQTSSALANARLYKRLQEQAGELQESNRSLVASVAALERSMTIHDRLTKVAVAGEGEEGIARALHDLTGWPVAIEDRYGNVRAWGGPGRPDPYPKQSQADRDALIRTARDAERPILDGDRLVTVASPRADAVGVIVLVGVPPDAAEQAQTAMEHGATVLSMELARLQSVAETELRLGRDLVEELLANTDEQAALSRAQALGYNLRQQHRVAIVIEDPPGRRDPDSRLRAVRHAALEAGLGRLLVPRAESVVVVAHGDPDWDAFQGQLLSGVGRNVWIGVGGSCDDLRDFPRSYHEATLAVRMRHAAREGSRTFFYEQLGSYRLLAEVGELSAIDRFVEEWIGALVAYDTKQGADLVSTLSSFLECRGNYDAAAAALSVHRNTLKYRLRRIREISGHDLKDADTLFNLQLAARAWATRRALETQTGEVSSPAPHRFL